MRVVAGIFYKDQKVLMGRRPSLEKFYGGWWEFPGGKVKEGESDEEALRREIKEELGVEVLNLSSFREVTWDYSDRRVELHFFWMELPSKELATLKLNAHDALRWWSFDEASELQVLPANVSVLEEAKLLQEPTPKIETTTLKNSPWSARN